MVGLWRQHASDWAADHSSRNAGLAALHPPTATAPPHAPTTRRHGEARAWLHVSQTLVLAGHSGGGQPARGRGPVAQLAGASPAPGGDTAGRTTSCGRRTEPGL